MHRYILVLLSLALAACGPDDAPPVNRPPVVTPPPPTPSVSSDFNGRWTGDVVVTSPGQTPSTQSGASLVLTANGQTLTATGFCVDGSGAMTATNQQGRSASWSGTVTCSYASTNCPSTTHVYRSATMSLDSGNTLTLVAYGTLAGCGYSFETTTTFTGRK